MHKKNFFFSAFLVCVHLLSFKSLATPPFFSNKLTTHTYFGQDLDILNIKPFTPYSLFQYIYDCGVQSLDTNLGKTKKQSFSFVANARIKGIFGKRGSGLVPLQQTKKFEIWMKELSLQYMPTENKNNFIKGGFFPFKVGNGFVLGNAYDINIPISWQYLYEQINQFRPGIQLQLGNQKNSISASAYVGFILVQNILSTPTASPTAKLLATTALFNVNSPFLVGGSNNVVTSLQLNFGPFDPHHIQISPYICLHATDQYVEIPDDATSKLYTPGIAFLYENNGLRINVEVAKNFGHQHVKALDRNAIITLNGITRNTQLFYAPQSANPLAPITASDFISSPLEVPDSDAAYYGNGTSFRYPASPTTTYTFKNSYDRFRKSYTNTYAGFLLYFNAVWTKKQWRWAVAAAYASGGNSPNDSPLTLFLTRQTPGVRYKDYNKTYKGFLGTNQFSEAGSINGLYFGPGNYRYTNFAVLGSTVAYTIPKEQDMFISQVTWVSYFKPEAQILDITDQKGNTLNTPLSQYLGTEFNGSTSYSLGDSFKVSLMGGIFLPGKNYTELKEQITFAELQTAKAINPALTSIRTVSPKKAAFFTSFAVIWMFDSDDVGKVVDRIFPNKKSS